MLRIALLLGLVAIVSAQDTDICGYNRTLYTTGPPSFCGLKAITDFPFEQRRAGPPICIVIGYCNRSVEAPITEQWFRPAWKIVFWPDVDRYSLLEIDGSFELLRNVSYQGMNNTRFFVKDNVPIMNRTDIAISIEIGKIASSARLLYSERCTEYTCFVVPFFTAMIEIDSNVPKQILWDDAGCYTCSGEACIGDFCGVDLNSGCKGPWTRGTLDCDLKVYLGWLGQDYRGNYLTSAGQRLSAFRTFSLATAYETAADTAAASRPQFPEEIPNIDFEDRGQAAPITVQLDDMHAGVAMLQPQHERAPAPSLQYAEPTYYLESNDGPHSAQ